MPKNNKDTSYISFIMLGDHAFTVYYNKKQLTDKYRDSVKDAIDKFYAEGYDELFIAKIMVCIDGIVHIKEFHKISIL